MTQPERRWTRPLQIALGLAISAGLIYWSFHSYSFADIWADIQVVQPLPMLLAVVLATLPFALRVPRWKLLLRHEDGVSIPTSPMWNAIAIGFAANNTLPLRAGEFLRVAAINRLARVSFASALASIAVERVIDGLVVVTLLGVGLVGGDLPAGDAMAAKAKVIGLTCLAAMAMAIVAAWQRQTTLRLLDRILPNGTFATKFVAFVDRVLQGLGAMRDPRRAIPVVLWSLIIWTVNALGFFVAFKAFGLDVPFAGALVLQGALVIGIAIPSSPGYFGVMETAISATLVLYGVDREHGLAYALVYHIATFIPITVMGAFAAIRAGMLVGRGPIPHE